MQQLSGWTQLFPFHSNGILSSSEDFIPIKWRCESELKTLKETAYTFHPLIFDCYMYYWLFTRILLQSFPGNDKSQEKAVNWNEVLLPKKTPILARFCRYSDLIPICRRSFSNTTPLFLQTNLKWRFKYAFPSSQITMFSFSEVLFKNSLLRH